MGGRGKAQRLPVSLPPAADCKGCIDYSEECSRDPGDCVENHLAGLTVLLRL